MAVKLSRKAERMAQIERVGPLLVFDPMTGILRLPPELVPSLAIVPEVEKEFV